MEFYQPDHRTIVKEIDFWPIIEIFDDFILGRNCKRTIHNLKYGESLLYQSFIDRLRVFQYQPLPMHAINVDFGKKIPVFYLKEDYAIFGYVFFITDSEQNKHKVFASVLKDESGRWKYTLNGQCDNVVFVNLSKQENIIDPIGFI